MRAIWLAPLLLLSCSPAEYTYKAVETKWHGTDGITLVADDGAQCFVRDGFGQMGAILAAEHVAVGEKFGCIWVPMPKAEKEK